MQQPSQRSVILPSGRVCLGIGVATLYFNFATMATQVKYLSRIIAVVKSARGIPSFDGFDIPDNRLQRFEAA